MRPKIRFVLLLLLSALAARGEDPLQKPILAPEQLPSAAAKKLHAVLAKDERKEPISKFTSDLPKIRAFWDGSGLAAGDRIGVIWLAEDVGIDAPHDSKITQAVTTAYKPEDSGVFALAQPKGGWPLGKYRCELYLNGKLTASIDFTIEKGATVQVQ
ncbi:MAG: hypothetical protein QOG48_1380 [Verrucomicrobiota bacterium]